MHLSEHKALIFTGIGISYSKSMVAYSAGVAEQVKQVKQLLHQNSEVLLQKIF